MDWLINISSQILAEYISDSKIERHHIANISTHIEIVMIPSDDYCGLAVITD